MNELPPFPSIKHIPWKPNTSKGDLVACVGEIEKNLKHKNVFIQEKIDGSFCAMTLINKNPVIRNRNHILKKGFSKKKSAAKQQFAPVWNWFYDNIEKFKALDGPYSVYGEWMLAQHGMFYDNLPSYFMAFELFDYEKQIFLSCDITQKLLSNFSILPILEENTDFQTLEEICNGKSNFSSNAKEGICIKVCNDREIIHRYKMVRQGFNQNSLWNSEKITRNKINATS